jgi:hypothetical protein
MYLKPIFVHLSDSFFVYAFFYAVGYNRINAAFCISPKFVPYRVSYDKKVELSYTNASNISSSCDLLNDCLYLINVISYGVFYSALLYKYEPTNIYIHVLNSTSGYDNTFTIAASGNTITVTSVNSKWHVCKINKLG